MHSADDSLFLGLFTDNSSIFVRLKDAIGLCLGEIAVPGFFLMSGFLFFHNLPLSFGMRGRVVSLGQKKAFENPVRLLNKLKGKTEFPGNYAGNFQSVAWPGFAFFIKKWKRRIWTLLIPYLIWNFIYYIIYLIAGRASLTFGDLLSAVLLHTYNPVFWYLRELIILTLLTPFLFWLLKNSRAALFSIVFLFFLAVFYDFFPMHLVNEDALFYYASGLYLSIWHFDTIKEDNLGNFWKKISLFSLLLCLLTFVLSQYLGSVGESGILSGNVLSLSGSESGLKSGSELFLAGLFSYRVAIGSEILFRLNGAIFVFSVISLIFEKNMRENSTLRGRIFSLTHLSFLIYVLHYLEIRFIWIIFSLFINFTGGSYRYISGDSLGYEIIDTAIFLLMPFLCIAITEAFDIIMKLFFPVMLRILTGDRG